MIYPTMKAIMVAYRNTFDDGRGGVQICTREYVDVLTNAGVDLKLCLFDSDMRLASRIKRRLWPSLYSNVIPPDLVERIVAMNNENPVSFVFLNQVTVAAIAEELRAQLPESCKIIVLSHGLESTDMLHAIRIKDKMPISWRSFPLPGMLLGSTIISEANYRRGVDLVISLSPFDASLELWLGVKQSIWLPRMIKPEPIDWHPSQFQFGFVGTLSHPPNLEGLVQALDAMQKLDSRMRVRIVGGPADIGEWVQSNHQNANYLGKLDDAALRIEARTWRAFLHPVFCIPRGCSTKLASGINWQIPIITTEPGHRGYEFERGSMIVAKTPKEFAQHCLELLDTDRLKHARQEIVDVSESSPDLPSITARLNLALDSMRASLTSAITGDKK